MARKRPFELSPPASTSVEEKGKEHDDEEKSSEGNSFPDDEPQNYAVDEDEEQDESEDEEKTPLKKQNTNSGKVSSDSESDSDKSPPSPNVSDFTIKPIVMKPNKSALKSTPMPKQIASESSSKQKKPPSSSSNGGGGPVKTPGTSRLWSESDEITILEGIVEFKSKKGSDPNADSSGFHDFIKQSIQADVTKNQLMEKIRRLKKKYKISAGKGQNGNGPVLSKPHDHKSFELSKKIWGNETNEKSNKSQKKMKTLGSEYEDKTEVNGEATLGLPCFLKDEEVNADVSTEVCSGSEVVKVDFWKDYPCLKRSFVTGRWEHAGGFLMELVEKMVGEIERDKLSEMEREWRELRREELELYLKRLELVREVVQAALNVIKGFD
ncbi:hypothetical protein CRYUN_Cryun10bG0078100 [Craigia yunnanensis]